METGYDTLTCLKNYLLFSLCILACSPLSPCLFPFVPASDLSFEPFFVVCTFFFELFCIQFFTFSFPVVLFPSLLYFSPPCRTFPLPVVLSPSLLYFFPSLLYFFPSCRIFPLPVVLFPFPVVLFPSLLYFSPPCRTFPLPVVLFPSLLYFFPSLSYVSPPCCTFPLPVVLFPSLSYFFPSLLYFSPPCCTRCLPIIPFLFVSFSFPPNRIFSSRDSVVLFSSQSYTFSSMFLKFTESNDIKIDHSKENKKKKEKNPCASDGNRAQSLLNTERTSCHCTDSLTGSETF